MTALRGISLDGPWAPREVEALDKALAELPRAWVEANPFLRGFVRRDVLREAPANAPGHSMYDGRARAIVFFDKGVTDPTRLRRSLYHELGHSLLRFDPTLLARWARATAGDGYVDAYARTGPDEDLCDTLSEYLISPDATKRVAPKKAQFVAQLLEHARVEEEKTAMAFIEAFVNELTKTAGPQSALRRLGGKVPALAGMAAMGAGGAAVGRALGKRTGEREGLQEGTALTGDVAQRAFREGVQRGASAMRDAMLNAVGK